MIMYCRNSPARSAEEVGLQKPDDDHFLGLFRPVVGSVISDKDLTIIGLVKPWTLGNYITKLHRSPSDIRFGVYRGCGSPNSEFLSAGLDNFILVDYSNVLIDTNMV